MTRLTVMTWNVQNLFLPDHEDGPDTQAAFDQKVTSLAVVIDSVRPHVLALQEIGPEGALAALHNALTHPMLHSAVGEPDRRGIRVAFLSRRVLQETNHVRPFPPGLLPIQTGDDPEGPEGPPTMRQMARGGLEVRLRAGNRDVWILTTHMKSKLLTFPGGRFQPTDETQRARFGSYALFRRATEATTLRARLNELVDADGKNRAVILTGDMNDEVEAATTQILNGPRGSEIGTVGFNRDDQGDDERMWNLAPIIPQAQRHTRVHRGRPEMIDHIFASHNLCNPNNLPAVATVRDPDPLPSMTDDPNARQNQPGSDHAAIAATFEI